MKTAVSTPGDRFEREADRIADQMQDAPPAAFAASFGPALRGARIHTDARAAAVATSYGARALTYGGDIYFNRGEYAPATTSGRRLIAHELTHVTQQANAAPMVMRDTTTPAPKNDTAEWMKKYFQASGPKRLNFFHGTRWSVAQKIPRNVKAVGGGDFAAGFYTHHDQNDKKAWFRSLQWGCRVARDAKEKYAGVIKFDVDGAKFAALSSQKNFNLTSTSQSDYTARQDDWIKFITTNGRKPDPVFQNRKGGGVWLHERVDPPPALAYDTVTGPFYKPLPGDASRKPTPGEFTPFVEGADTLPQQVVFANKGCDLLNDADTKIDLTQHDCSTGNRVEPPDTTAAAAAGTPSGKEVPMIE